MLDSIAPFAFYLAQFSAPQQIFRWFSVALTSNVLNLQYKYFI
ncbi:hypothetical protein CFter6_1383 [Collimonas fungivorans]|uniref:Uncharacterized protein n=1 Tax=Collimonas fungivorans TaxID=158899 RepID=A0A127P8M8_9BURK|nr:hypothetical protein CFter6_1383 [Collimonas fungivorans]